MKVPTVSAKDIHQAFGADSKSAKHRQVRLELEEEFIELWNAELGHLFECPDRNQIKTWMRMCGWDFTLLDESIADLRNRAQSPMNPGDPYAHGLRHFSASLIRKTRAKYGVVRPTEQRAA